MLLLHADVEAANHIGMLHGAYRSGLSDKAFSKREADAKIPLDDDRSLSDGIVAEQDLRLSSLP